MTNKSKPKGTLAAGLASGWSVIVALFYLTLMGPSIGSLFSPDPSTSSQPRILQQVTCQRDSMSAVVPAQANSYRAALRTPDGLITAAEVNAHPSHSMTVRFAKPQLEQRPTALFIDIFTGSDQPQYREICVQFGFVRTFWLLNFLALLGAWGPSLILADRLGLKMYWGPAIFSLLSLATLTRLFVSGSALRLMMVGYCTIIIVTFAAVEMQRQRKKQIASGAIT